MTTDNDVSSSVQKLVDAMRAGAAEMESLRAEHCAAEEVLADKIAQTKSCLRNALLAGQTLGDPVDDFLFLTTGDLNQSFSKDGFIKFRDLIARFSGDFIYVEITELHTVIHRSSFVASPFDNDGKMPACECFLGLIKENALEFSGHRQDVTIKFVAGCSSRNDKPCQELVMPIEYFGSWLVRPDYNPARDRIITILDPHEFFLRPPGGLEDTHLAFRSLGGGYPAGQIYFGCQSIFRVLMPHTLEPLAKKLGAQMDWENRRLTLGQLDLLP